MALKFQAVRLWMHECERVFRDRLVSEADATKFDEFRVAATKKFFEDLPGGMPALEERPLLFTSFMQAGGATAGPQNSLVGVCGLAL